MCARNQRKGCQFCKVRFVLHMAIFVTMSIAISVVNKKHCRHLWTENVQRRLLFCGSQACCCWSKQVRSNARSSRTKHSGLRKAGTLLSSSHTPSHAWQHCTGSEPSALPQTPYAGSGHRWFSTVAHFDGPRRLTVETFSLIGWLENEAEATKKTCVSARLNSYCCMSAEACASVAIMKRRQ